jgi:hypothetical protein
MLEFHRVFAHYDDELWVGVAWLAKRASLKPDMKYVTLPVAQQKDVCLALPDGRVLCDYGPGHVHG